MRRPPERRVSRDRSPTVAEHLSITSHVRDHPGSPGVTDDRRDTPHAAPPGTEVGNVDALRLPANGMFVVRAQNTALVGVRLPEHSTNAPPGATFT